VNNHRQYGALQDGSLEHCCKGLSVPELAVPVRIKVQLHWYSCTFSLLS
jgi:hypothetical protein